MELNLAIEYRALGTLEVDPSNPRKHTPRQIRKLTEAIRAPARRSSSPT